MTPIRCRIWDGETMHEPADLGDGGRDFVVAPTGQVYELEWSLRVTEWPDAVALRSTGLTDAEGREVFEGDVVEYWDGMRSVVEWATLGFRVRGHHEDTAEIILSDCRIVGHVYEEAYAHLREREPA